MPESAQQPAHKAIPARQTTQPDSEQPEELLEQTASDSAALVQQAANAPRLLSPSSILQLQRTIGNKATQQLIAASRQCTLQKEPRAAIASTANMSPQAIQRRGNVADTAAGLEGSLNWVASGTKKKGKALALDSSTGVLFWKKANNFMRWVKGKEGFPEDTGNMNCWEAIIYSAVKAEAIDADAVRTAYMTALNAANAIMAAEGGKIEDARNAFNESLRNWLGYSAGRKLVDGQPVEKGRLIMNDLQHVVIAVDAEEMEGDDEDDDDRPWDGGTIVMSLGHFDENENKKKTTFTKTRLWSVWSAEIRKNLKVVTPPWSNS